jgi:RNA polymerase sigma-54 factor
MPRPRLAPSTNIKLKNNLRGVLNLHEALRILQMPATDLRDEINSYLSSNPMLERDETTNNDPDIEIHERMDYPTRTRNFDEALSEDNIKSHDKSIRDVLMEEPQLAFDDNYRNGIKEFIVGNIDDNGFLMCDCDEVANQLEVPMEDVEEILHLIQEAAPPGVGARTPEESILLRLRRDFEGEDLRLGEAIISEHWPKLKKRRFNEVANILDSSPEKIYEIWNKISRYTFTPGSNYAPSANYITPEIAIKSEGSDLIIQPLKDGIPAISINQEYAQLMKDTDDSETIGFLRDKMTEAKWLLKAIDQRKRNVLKIVSEISRVQKEFFTTGNKSLKPLTLRDVAQNVGLVPSTVSRAINNKYIVTPQGTYPLKFFFTGGFSNGKGKVSNVAVKETVKELASTGSHTDKEMSEIIFEKLKIKISRRAVAQYRKDLGIASSVDKGKNGYSDAV